MPDPQDIVEIPGVINPAAARFAPADSGPARPWLGVLFKCCHVYGRMYRDADGVRYTGRCPRCTAEVSARVGPGGTSQRIFFTE